MKKCLPVIKAQKTSFFVILISLLSSLSGEKAIADTYWDFSYNLGGVGAQGTFQVNSLNVIVGIQNGTVFGLGANQQIIGVLAPGAYQGNDNLFNPSGSPSFLNFNGVSFNTSASNYNLYYDNEVLAYTFSGNFGTNTGTFNAAQELPEINGATFPKAILLLGSLYLISTSRRKRGELDSDVASENQ
jgi:hypothetical protein